MTKGKYIEMQTEIMEKYPPSSPHELEETFNLTATKKKYLDDLFKKMRKSHVFTQIKDIVESNYDIVQVLEAY